MVTLDDAEKIVRKFAQNLGMRYTVKEDKGIVGKGMYHVFKVSAGLLTGNLCTIFVPSRDEGRDALIEIIGNKHLISYLGSQSSTFSIEGKDPIMWLKEQFAGLGCRTKYIGK